MKRNVDLKFVLEGVKDAIDYDLASSQMIKEWESWGGNDTIVVSSQTLKDLLWRKSSSSLICWYAAYGHCSYCAFG